MCGHKIYTMRHMPDTRNASYKHGRRYIDYHQLVDRPVRLPAVLLLALLLVKIKYDALFLHWCLALAGLVSLRTCLYPSPLLMHAAMYAPFFIYAALSVYQIRYVHH